MIEAAIVALGVLVLVGVPLAIYALGTYIKEFREVEKKHEALAKQAIQDKNLLVYHVGQLRALYRSMVEGSVQNSRIAATTIVGPAIVQIEKCLKGSDE